MKSILESKIFASLNTDRQNKIKAALLNPVNVELVQQLSSYLNENTIEELENNDFENVPVEDSKVKENDSDSNLTVPEIDESEHKTSHIVPNISRSSSTVEPNVYTDTENQEYDPIDVDNTSAEAISDDTSKEELNKGPNEDEIQSSSKIESSTCIPCKPVDIEVIKGTLNSRDDTKGVSQIRIKDSFEMWIYYQDNINLNNIMPAVVDLITRLNSHLEFNRLARSNNAIVFDFQLE